MNGVFMSRHWSHILTFIFSEANSVYFTQSKWPLGFFVGDLCPWEECHRARDLVILRLPCSVHNCNCLCLTYLGVFSCTSNDSCSLSPEPTRFRSLSLFPTFRSVWMPPFTVVLGTCNNTQLCACVRPTNNGNGRKRKYGNHLSQFVYNHIY